MKFFVPFSILFLLLCLTSCNSISNQRYSHLEKIKRNPSITQNILTENVIVEETYYPEKLNDSRVLDEKIIECKQSQKIQLIQHKTFQKNYSLSSSQKAITKAKHKSGNKAKSSITLTKKSRIIWFIVLMVVGYLMAYIFPIAGIILMLLGALLLCRTKKQLAIFFFILAAVLVLLSIVILAGSSPINALWFSVPATLLLIAAIVLSKDKPSNIFIIGWAALVISVSALYTLFVLFLQALSEFSLGTW